ncbi:MAG TPA: polysaccharide lyase family 8 super-sandwich domain-containing protein, partial [Anseongella sp.]|nr:polysaccharide lyase family 8 super-sandwich domain-containing protein [Anseongella sp.]
MNALNAFLPGLLCFVLALVYPAGSIAGPGLETLRKRVVEELLEPAVNPARIKLLLGSIREDGSWEGINYQDTSRTGFEHSRHLENLLDLARALKKPGSAYYGNPEVERAAGAGLDFWIAHDFLCENWWWNQIGTPDRMVSILLVLDRELSQAQREGAAPIAGRANLEAWGARPGGDLIKIAGILGRYGLFKRDSALVKEAVKAITGEIMFAADRGDPSDLRGLQVDMSFQHRDDRVISTLSYGLGYAEAFAGWAALAAGTEFSFPPEALELLVDFYLDGICRTMVHGKYPDPGAKNRGITRKGALRPAGPELPENLLKATSYRKEELREIIKIRRGEAKPALAGSRFFWSSEYFSYQRPDFFASVRMYSSRNHSVEVPYNEEGLKNHHLADGSNFISRTGEEYAGVFPVWDWQKIPGTTVLQKPALPPPDAIQQKGLRSFAGAVSDGRYGAAAVDFKSPLDGLEAKKAWFFFDREYVCLGSGISAPAPYPVATTINQCLLQQEVIVMENGRMSAPEKGVHS